MDSGLKTTLLGFLSNKNARIAILVKPIDFYKFFETRRFFQIGRA
jgi:hypothetical protein